MVPIERLFEAHLSVRDFERSVAFYIELVGLELGIVQPKRPAAFFGVGGRGQSMMGIFGVRSGTLPKQHKVAFQVRLEDALAAPQRLRSLGITALGGHREPNEPIVFPWMPAASVCFDDPDGNVLEYISMLPNRPRPEPEPVSWSEWKIAQQNRRD